MDRHTTAASEDNHILVTTCTAGEAFQAVAYTSTEATCLVTTSSSAADQDNLSLLDPVIACKASIVVGTCQDSVASSSLLPFAVGRVVSSSPYS